jgi:hypothetical protein
VLPSHPSFPTSIINSHETYSDPYSYLHSPSEAQTREFSSKEFSYLSALSLKHNFLTETFIRELTSRSLVPHPVPSQVGPYLYYRNISNAADFLTVYRYPIDKVELKERMKVPTKELDLNEQVVFKIKDLVDLYDQYALRVSQIKEFVEKISDISVVANRYPIYWVGVQSKGRYVALVFDTDGNGKGYDIVVKDMKKGKMEPIVVCGTNGEVAFDRLDGFYYVLKDMNGRGKKLNS